MIDSAMKILSNINMYTISLIIIVCGFLLSLVSEQFKRGMKIPLQICIVVWVIFFGYEVYTGNNLYSHITAPPEPERYKKVMIDGREVIYDKDTNEIVKPAKGKE